MNPDPQRPAIVLEALTRQFVVRGESPVTAVDRLSLEIRQGEVFCLVGPDGAGKTTTIRMMCGVIAPTSGTIRILGLDQQTHKEEIKNHIGYLSQRFSLYGDLTIDENIDFFAEIHGVRDYGARKSELLSVTRLTPFRDRLAARLSGGMKQKLALACTLIHTPDIIVLDEPTTGVDPVSRRDFWKILSNLLKTGITIVVSTPYLDEAERSTRVAMINQGALLECDTPDRLKAAFRSSVLEIICNDPRTAVAILSERAGRENVQLFGDRLHVLVEERDGRREEYEEVLQEKGLELRGVRWMSPSLEDVFVSRMKK